MKRVHLIPENNSVTKITFILREIDRISEKVAILASFLTFIMMLLVVYEVASRYFANRPTVWSMELCQFTFTYIIALGGAYTLKTDGHVSVDILYSRLGPRVQSIIDVVTTTMVIVFLITLVWQTGIMSVEALTGSEHTGTAFNPPTFPAKVIIPIGVFIFILQAVALLIRNIVRAVTSGIRPEEEGTPAKENGH